MWYTVNMQTNKRGPNDLAGILDSAYENKWVAIASDYSRVIAVAMTLRELMQTVTDQNAIFHRVLPRDVSFAPLVSFRA